PEKQEDLEHYGLESHYYPSIKISRNYSDNRFAVHALKYILISKMILLTRHVGRDCRHPEHKDVLGPLPSVASGLRQSLPERRF
ncbi:MAG: hypothetical protein ACRER2_17945, partial [Methylococcales bacterium]